MIRRIIIFSAVIIGMLQIASCDKKQPESDLSIFQKQVSQTWKFQKATRDGVDVTSYYPNLSITIGATTITSTNGVNPLWKSSVSYTIGGTTSPFALQRADGITMTVASVDASKLVLEFNYDAVAAGGRTQSVSGRYHVEFTIN